MTTDDKRKRRRGVLFSPVLSLQAWRAQHSRRGLEREGLGSEPEVRGSLAVRAPPHPGLVFFTPSHPHRSTRDPTGSGSEECESRRSPSNARGAGGRVRQPPDCGGRRSLWLDLWQPRLPDREPEPDSHRQNVGQRPNRNLSLTNVSKRTNVIRFRTAWRDARSLRAEVPDFSGRILSSPGLASWVQGEAPGRPPHIFIPPREPAWPERSLPIATGARPAGFGEGPLALSTSPAIHSARPPCGTRHRIT